MGKHIEKGYIYFAMAFALLVEFLNLRVRKAAPPVHLPGASSAPHVGERGGVPVPADGGRGEPSDKVR
jgi:hypothetical protein